MSEMPWLKHYPQGVRGALDYPQVPVFRLLEQQAVQNPDLPAINFYGHKLTFRQLAGAANKCANLLKSMGVSPGDRVAIMMPNCPQFVIAFFGVLKAGGIVAQVNPMYTEREIEYLCNNAGCRIMIVSDLLYPKVQNALQGTGLKEVLVSKLKGEVALGPEARSFDEALTTVPPTDPGVAVSHEAVAVLQYTGGTTGVSKGAMLTHFNLVANVLQIAEWFAPMRQPGVQERILTVLPLFHSYGMTVCMNYGIYTGAELILLPRADMQEIMQTIKTTQPTSFPGVPTMYVGVNAFPGAEEFGVSSIRTCFSGAAPLPVEVMHSFEKRFGATIVEGYGLSEASPVTHCNPLAGMRKAGSVGLAYPDTDCRVVDLETGTSELPVGEQGELIIKGPQIMAGYWQMPEETRNTLREWNGETWLYTGDIGRMDEDGYFYITDRKKDMIIASGFNIYPRDVEEVLYQHPAVQECVVAGVPDAYRGETVKAYIVLKANQSLTEADLDAFCRQHLAAYKVPRLFEFRAALPKSMVGKVLRRVLVEEEKAKLTKAAAQA